MFKNAVFYRVEPGFKITAEALATVPARPCGPQEFETVGFAAPRQSAPDLLIHQTSGYSLIALEIEQRLLPAAVVKEEVAERIKAIEDNEGRRVGRREKHEIEEAVTQEFLPKSFTKKKRIYAVFAGGLLIVEGGKSHGEMMTETLLRAANECFISAYRVNESISTVITGWLSGSAPDGMYLDNFCQLESAEGKSITYRTSLDGDDIPGRIAAGYVASRVAITIGERSSLIVTDKYEIKRFTLLDIITEKAHDESGAETAEERFDIDLTLYVGELLRSIDALTESFGGERQDLADQGSETVANIPDGDGSANDPLYEQAVSVVKANQRASISLVQRHLRVGYNRAARMIEAMEKAGIVSPQTSDGNRQVFGEAA